MGGEGVNSIAVLGRDLLLVEVGGGAENHLAEAVRDHRGRPAVDPERFDRGSPRYMPTTDQYDQSALLAPRWESATLCGRLWQEMAAGESGALRRWQETSLVPTCRSCLRVVDTWFPRSDVSAGVEILAAVIAEEVEELGSARVTSVPAEHLEAVRRRARSHLRATGYRSTTHVIGDVLHVLSQDASEAIELEVELGWINEAVSGLTLGAAPDGRALRRAREPIDWYTWVVDG